MRCAFISQRCAEKLLVGDESGRAGAVHPSALCLRLGGVVIIDAGVVHSSAWWR